MTIKDIKKINKELNEKITCPFVLVDLKTENPDFYILSRSQMRRLIIKDWNFWVTEHRHHKPIRQKEVQIIFQLRETMRLLEKYKDKWENIRRS